MKPNDKDKSFQQRREELQKSRLITDNVNQSSQYLESLIEDVVLNGLSFDNQLPFLLSYAAREGLDAEQLKNDIVVLLGMIHPISKQPSKLEKMAILYQAQICYISEEKIQHILSDLQEKKKKEQVEAEKRAREKAEAERRAREKAEAEKRARQQAEAEKRAREKVEAERRAREKAEAEKRARQQIFDNLTYNMVYVSGGTFMMGATSEQGSDADDYEKPAHRVTLSSFSIGRYEVTQEEWEAVMGSNPSEFKGKKQPVGSVSWDDCQEFILKLNAMTGKTFRLPTEAEWEYAARGGNKSKGYKYSGSNNIDSVAWYEDNSGKTTHPVGQKSPNELGLYDMSGNVWEWCSDWYGDYRPSSQTNPKGADSGTYRVLRGGGWSYSAGICRVSSRACDAPGVRYGNLGLRLAL